MTSMHSGGASAVARWPTGGTSVKRSSRSMKRASLSAIVAPTLIAAVAILGALVPAALRAQTPGGPPEKFENLKVFSKDIPRDSLLGIMRGFTGALGVNCTYCHV